MLPTAKAAAAAVAAMKKSSEKSARARPEEAGSKKTKNAKEEEDKAPVKPEKVELEWKEKLEEGIASAMEALMTVSDLPPAEEAEEPVVEAKPLLATAAESMTPHAALASMLAEVPATAAIPEVDDDDSDASSDDSIEEPKKKKKNKDRLSAENKNKLEKARDGGEANKARRPSEASSKKSYNSLPKNSAATRRMRVTRQSGGDGGAAEPTVLALAHALIVETIVGETPGTLPTEKAAAVNVPIIEKVKEKVVDKVLGELADEIEVATTGPTEVPTDVPTTPPTSVTPKCSRPTSHSTPPARQSPTEKKENVAPPRRPSATIKIELGVVAGAQTIEPAVTAAAKLAPRANVPKSTTAHKQKPPHRSLSTAERS